MACDIQGILNGSSALSAELANYSTQEVLWALYALNCQAAQAVNGTIDCSPSVLLSTIDPCIACLSPQELLTAIAGMLCGNPAVAGSCAAPVASYAQPANGVRGQPYSWKLSLLRGVATAWEIVEGELPLGLSLDSATGVISGTVSASAVDENLFLVRAGNQCGWDYELLSIRVDDTCFAPTIVVPGNEIRCTVGQFVRGHAGMTGSYPGTWSITGGALPPGLVWAPFSEVAVVEGTPTQAGNYSTDITVVNPCGSDTKTVHFKVFNP